MKITPEQHRTLYGIFLALFALNVGISIWNIREQHKLRKTQAKLAEEQLKAAHRKNSQT